MSPKGEVERAGERLLLTGNHAVAHAACLARPDLIPVYPITPQTPILEKLAELKARGHLHADLMTVESEHSAMAACITASLAGTRVFTATSSQGLALMHEMLHWAAGSRAPVVMANVNRTLAAPWGFWADQTDSLAQRDTGWMQLYCESPQEALDSVLVAFRVAERVLLPAMVMIEAMYVSHALEPVDLPPEDVVAGFLPPFDPPLRIDPAQPRAIGGTMTPAQWRENRIAMQAAMDLVPGVLEEAAREWRARSGRRHGALDLHRVEDAELVVVAAGSMVGTFRAAVDRLRDDGVRAGLVKIRLFRPFPDRELAEALARARKIAVVDRNYSIGAGGIFCQEVRAALHAHRVASPAVYPYVIGLGGLNVSVERAMQVVQDMARRKEPPARPILEEAL